MELASSVLKDVSVLRRMLFATAFLPGELPHYWEVIASFSCLGSSTIVSADTVKLLMENLQFLNDQAFATDAKLRRDLMNAVAGEPSLEPLGVVLVSNNQTCRSCGGELLVRQDRSSRVILYTEDMGTVPATHYHKYCHIQRR